MGALNRSQSYRLVEIGAILAFLVATAALVVADPSPGALAVEKLPSSPTIEAHAYATPN